MNNPGWMLAGALQIWMMTAMLVDEATFRANVERLRERMAKASERAGRRAEEVRLLPVTKTHPVEAAAMALRAGFETVGENRVQEAVEKQQQLPALGWELIGHLQSNKAKLAISHFARVQSVDSLKLATRLDRLAGEAGRRLPVLLQVNAGADPAKFGCELGEAQAVAEAMAALEHLALEGLMTIAPLDEDASVAQTCFANLRQLRDRLQGPTGLPLTELSMGMSGDLELAIAEGSTMIRVGTDLFGARH